MEFKKNAALVVVLMMLLTINTFAEEKIYRLNTHPLMKGIQNVDELKAQVEKYADRIKEGFDKTTEADLYPAFMEQVKSGNNIKEQILPKGQRFKWMLFYPHKQIKVVQAVEWAGKATINAYVVTVEQEQECKRFEFLIPKICGNICFVEGFNGDAICHLEVTPKEAQTGESVTVDMSGSKCAAAYDITVSREGKQVDSKNLKDGEKSWQTSFKVPGVYEFTAQALNNNGVASKNECRASISIMPPEVSVGPDTQSPQKPDTSETRSTPRTDQKKLYFLAEAGPMIAKGTYTGYFFARLGLAYFMVPEKLSFLVSGGYAVNLGGDAFKNHFLSNLLLNLHFKKIFVGGGFGFSSKVRNAIYEDGVLRPQWKANFDVVGNVGYDIFTTSNKKGALFGEIRLPIKTGLEIKRNHAFLLGFRILF